MILVTGASGHFGNATIDFLLDKGVKPNNIIGLVRNESKAEPLKAKGVQVRIGDYSNYDSLLKAFDGVEKLLLVSGNELPNRSQLHENVVKAAKEAGVQHIVYTSFERKNESEKSPLAAVGKSHLHTEDLMKESGMAYTILRNNLYTEFIPLFLGPKTLDTGVYFSAGEGKVATATRTDMAEAAANVLMNNGHQNKEYNISNTEEVSFKDIAEILSNIAGKEVPYYSPDKNTYLETLTSAGVSKENAMVSAAFADAIKQGELSPVNRDLESLLGRKPKSVRDFLFEYYSKSAVKVK